MPSEGAVILDGHGHLDLERDRQHRTTAPVALEHRSGVGGELLAYLELGVLRGVLDVEKRVRGRVRGCLHDGEVGVAVPGPLSDDAVVVGGWKPLEPIPNLKEKIELTYQPICSDVPLVL